MNRPLPTISEPELTAMAVFHPNGAQVLEVGIAGTASDTVYTRDQVRQLKDIIDAFERQCTFEDGRPSERFRMHKEPLS